MFDIDIAGLRELEGGKPPHRLAFEPVSNVFDEYRRGEPEEVAADGAEERTRAIDLGERSQRPTYCHVKLEYNHDSPRGVWITVTDDGPGFANPADIWTVFGSTPKRSDPRLAGRFNFGEKQLFSLARKAQVCTGRTCVTFENGKREVLNFRKEDKRYTETTVTALMPWSQADMALVRAELKLCRPPGELKYFVDDVEMRQQPYIVTVNLVLPTVRLADGCMKDTTRKTKVEIFPPDGAKAMLFELGIPVCDFEDLAFPWSVNVQQKIPLPMSRDMVSTAYLYRLIGGCIEQAATQNVSLLSPEEAGAPFIRGALEWVRDKDALDMAVRAVYGENAVRISNDSTANARAVESGATLISGKEFGEQTRRRLHDFSLLRTSHEIYNRPTATAQAQRDGERGNCPRCGRPY